MRRTIIAITLPLALAACGRGAPAGNAAPAAPPEGSFAAPDGGGALRGDARASGLPAGIPAYPRMNAGRALQMGGESDGNEMRVTGFRTADPPERVIAFYSDAGTRAGFRIVQRAESGPSSVLGLARDDGEAMNVTATATPTGTSVQIMAGRERRRR